MALFDFVKSIGEKLFDRDEKAAERIRKRIESANPGVRNVKVDYDDGVVTLSGEANNRSALAKTVLIAGNVKGVGEVKLDDFTVDSAPIKETADVQSASIDSDQVEYYTIQSGDTLSGIARRYYGDAMEYPRIFEANREVIRNPDLIYPGQKIRIPLDKEAA